jgi:hypothetical protein
MTDPNPTPKLRFRWTKRLTTRAEIVYVVERQRPLFTLLVVQRGEEWIAEMIRFRADLDKSQDGFATQRDAQLWAESQVPA